MKKRFSSILRYGQAPRKLAKGIAEYRSPDEMDSMANAEPIVFEPLPMERVWGGRRLEDLYGKTLPQGAPIGESWEIVDREDAQSVVHSGTFRGTTLHELWTRRRGERRAGREGISRPRTG